jgi:glycosyltransferase involved in cell wall biosynthesis
VSTSLATRGGISGLVRSLRDTPLWDEWQVRHISTHRDGSTLVRAVAFARGAAEFGWALTTDPPALVHLHTASYGSFARKALLAHVCRLAGVPYVLHVHGGEFVRFHDRSPRWARRRIRGTLTAAHCVLALGQTWAGRLAGLAPEARIEVLPNGVRPGALVPQPGSTEPVHVVFLGDVRDDKGVFVLVEAWSRVMAERGRRELRLTIAGTGDLEALRARVAERGVAVSVAVPGWIPPERVPELLGTAQVLVLPSRHEGQPMAVLEAMARGLCIVATDVGGIPDLVDSRSGILVPADDVAALAEALLTAVHDDDRRTRLGLAGWRRVKEEFDVTVVADRLDAVYRSCVDGSRSPSLHPGSGSPGTASWTAHRSTSWRT